MYDHFAKAARAVIYSDLKNALAEVSKPGQPRGTQDLYNKISLPLGVRGFKSHPLHFFVKKLCFDYFGRVDGML